MLDKQLASDVAGIILEHVRESKGRLTQVSDMCRINRREFTRRGLASMKLYRLLRIIYAVILVAPCQEGTRMMNELRDVLMDSVDEHEDFFFDD